MTNEHYIIDVRSAEEFARGHIEESYSFPWITINDEACGLPERSAELTIIVSEEMQKAETITNTTEHIDNNNDENNNNYYNTVATAQLQTRQTDITTFFKKLGYSSVRVCLISELDAPYTTKVPPPPSVHCWSPNSFLAEHIELIEHETDTRCALDVGAGTGRDMVFLALRKWVVWGIDNRLKLLTQGRRLAHRHHVDHYVQHLVCDLRHGLPFADYTFDLVHICRFIHRPSLPHVLKLLRPGGWLLYAHFLEGCQFTSVGRPKNINGFFAEGEMEQLIKENGLRLGFSSRVLLADGRPMICALARRPTDIASNNQRRNRSTKQAKRE